MDESFGPVQLDCPDSILKLLSPTNNEFALDWRRKCRQKNDMKRKLKTLKEGSKILVFVTKEKEIPFIKQEFDGKKYWVKEDQRNTYIKQSDVLRLGFEILETVV